MRWYCTYCDRNYLVRMLALAESLKAHETQPYTLFVVCLDELTRTLLHHLNLDGVTTIGLHEVEQNDPELRKAKQSRSLVEYYWTLTPTVLSRIFEWNQHIDQLTYLDADLYFFSSPEPVFTEQPTASVLIHSHRFAERYRHLEALGRYNVGLLSFRRTPEALCLLSRWRIQCIEWCYGHLEDKKFGDQLYLDDWPEQGEHVHVLLHPGIGVAPWNQNDSIMGQTAQGQLLVDGKPLIFYHFHSLGILTPELFAPARHLHYQFSLTVLRLCYLPYLHSLQKNIKEISHILPEFTCDMSTPANSAVHTLLASRSVATELSKHLEHFTALAIDDYWSICRLTQSNQTTTTNLPSIIIDGVFFQYRVTGIARVWEELLRQWATMPIAQHLLVLDRDGTCPRIDGLRYRTIARHDYTNLVADQQMLQQVCDEEGATLFISTYYSTPLTTPSLLLIHDCIPEALGADLRQPAWQEKRHAIQYAASYCTVSAHTAQDLLQYYPEVAQRPLLTIHNGVSETFAPADHHEINLFQTQFGITKPYYLFVGPVEWYKNFTLLIEAFNQLPNRHDYLIVRTRAEEDDTPAMPGVITTGRLSDAQLCAAYSGALALVYPSWYEGFGLPVVEAMACGCPVIAANATSIPEVAGGAAWLIPPHEREAMVTALLALQQPEVRQHLSQAGLKRAQQFSWKRTAEELMEAIYTHGMIV